MGVKTDTFNVEFYYVRAKVVKASDTETSEVYLGTVQGAGDNGQPGWTSWDKTPFKTARDAFASVGSWLCVPYGSTLVEGSVEIVHRRTVTTVTTVDDIVRG